MTAPELKVIVALDGEKIETIDVSFNHRTSLRSFVLDTGAGNNHPQPDRGILWRSYTITFQEDRIPEHFG